MSIAFGVSWTADGHIRQGLVRVDRAISMPLPAAAARAQGTSWNVGSWMGQKLTGEGWCTDSWTGRSWAGSSWSRTFWTGSSWSGSSWTGSSWTSNSWSGAGWAP